MKLSIVIPCYNEQNAIAPVLRRTREAINKIPTNHIQDSEIIVVDDASTDQSFEKLMLHEDVRLIKCPHNLGYGAALKIGLQASQGDLIAFFDMDDTYDPYDLPQMIQIMLDRNLKMVSGNRLSNMGGMPWTRYIGNNLFVWTIRALFQKTIYDSCSGMRLLRKDVVRLFSIELPNHLNFTLAMTLLCLQLKIPFIEIPINYRQRIGESKLSLFYDGFRFLSTILKIRLATIFLKKWSTKSKINLYADNQ